MAVFEVTTEDPVLASIWVLFLCLAIGETAFRAISLRRSALASEVEPSHLFDPRRQR